MNKPIHVAVAVVQKPDGRILIARRPSHLHQGGLWEFPGGKLEAGEDVVSGLRRELQEELGVEALRTQPLICIPYDYGDKTVLLDVHRVIEFSGEAHGREGQAVQWIGIEQLDDFDFPAANRGIVNALRLPNRYMITGAFSSTADCLARIEQALARGVHLLQLRVPGLPELEYLALAHEISQRLPAAARLMLNTSPQLFARSGAAGLHLNSRRLMQLHERPVAEDKLLSVAVHNQVELDRAGKIAADMVLISPVRETATHSGVAPLGWDGFEQLARQANCPVFALGGMTAADLPAVLRHGGHGIAAIRELWPLASVY